MDQGLFINLASRTIPTGTNLIHTSGRSDEGVYPARYYDATDQVDSTTGLMPGPLAFYNNAADKPTALTQLLAIQGRISVRTNGGTRFWIIDESNGDVHAGHWGAVADATYNQSTGAMGGTDSQPALQAMVDWMTYIHRRTPRDQTIRIPAGTFRLGRTLRLGYGQYHNATLIGDGKSFAYDQNGGTTLFCDFSDEPGIAMSAGAWAGVRNLTLFGKLARRAFSFSFDGLAKSEDFLDRDVWEDPNLPGTDPNLRYSPYAGIAIDPFNGAAPAGQPHYESDASPAWIDAALRNRLYGLTAGSTAPVFEDVQITGFTVGLVMQPSDFDANGDFLTLNRCHIGLCAFGVSVGNTQSRNVRLHNCNFGRVHTMLTTSTHGRQLGVMEGVVLDCSSSEIIKIVEFHNASAYWGPVRFQSFYTENCFEIGTIYYGAAMMGELVFAESSFVFTMQNAAPGGMGVPKGMLRAPDGVPLSGGGKVLFERCHFINHPQVLPMPLYNLIVRDTQIRPDWYDTHAAAAPAWERKAMNTLAGGLALYRLRPGEHPHSIDHEVLNLSGGPNRHLLSAPGATWTSRALTASLYCTTMRSSLDDREYPNLLQIYEANMTSLSNSNFNAATGTWTFTVSSSTEGPIQGLALGAVWMTDDQFLFFVKDVTVSGSDYTITLQIKSGFRVAANGTYEYPFGSPNTTTGRFDAYSGGAFVPQYPTRFDVAASSNVLTNVQTGVGWDMAPQFAVGDMIMPNRFLDDWLGGYNAVKVTAVTPKQLTIQAAAPAARTGKRIEMAVRAGA